MSDRDSLLTRQNLNVGNKKLGNNVVFEKPSIKR